MTTIKATSIADIKKRIKESKNKTTQFKSTVDKSFFPFWKMEEGEHAVVRLLPDINPENPMPYFVESFNHTLAIDGDDRKIACPKTFDRTAECPICDLSQKYYRDGDKDKGRYYWRNKNSFVRLLVLESPLDVKDENGEPVDYVGRVCTSMFGKQVLQSIEESLSEFSDDQPVPWMIDDGYDFTIKKVKMGGDGNESYMTYAFSKFAHRSSGIAEQYKPVVEESLINFTDLLPDRPELEKVQNYLDAHLGVADFQYSGGNPSSEESDSKPATPVATTVAPVAETVAPVAGTIAPASTTIAPEAETIVQSAETVTLNADDTDQDMIDKILNRK